ncbi:MAG: type I phosphomannose isomerase catalytic subunit [Tenuifilaceae bacterium]|jgi:mannose-6-phosphate isomerase|nr:mannose-6-phosphate isomerase [Bacteroidales bacterium]MDI9515460.1 mannose-6-phosphate isomerase [Bacteroidota bacterium]HNV81183.1 mannose-6-phosphate isomerase [Tenuifilaceae bacterium]MZP82825.1 mannose-6-phosphate isomerase [Bacteroidales bacterium]HOF92144.1 mannose-6-phosphate isomerase [Tenuifilaceae bacterium]
MLYPLKFNPILKERIWGGRRLIEEYGKKPSGSMEKPYGESWELSAVQDNVSTVMNGFLAGNSLQELIEVYMGDLVGDRVYRQFGLEFPLLIKLIDTADYLSIQVHPDDAMANRLHGANGKTEMWYVLDSGKDSWIITGFAKELAKSEYFDVLAKGTLSQYLRYELVEKDDFFYIPAGRVHAIGKGVTLIEIQQTSDITYRIYDWDRVDEKGKSRELHTKLAVEAIDFSVTPETKVNKKCEINVSNEIVHSPFFKTNHLSINRSMNRDFFKLDSFVVYFCSEGKVSLETSSHEDFTLSKGELALVPAALENITLTPMNEAKILEIYY